MGGRVRGLSARYRAVVFDFDGTLVDSNALKRETFAHTFADQPECLRRLPGELDAHKHESRYEIIAALVRHIEGLTSAQRLAESSRRTELYSTTVEALILERAAQSPAKALLPRWQQMAALYVCSLTPIEPLTRVLGLAGWLSYFSGVEGYPVSKADMLRRTVARHGVRNDEVLMVGDGDSDEAAARDAGTPFFRIRDLPDLLLLDHALAP